MIGSRMDKTVAVARCHEIQLAIRERDVPRLEAIPEIGMSVQLALHLRGLPPIDYDRVKLIASTVLGIPRLAVDRIVGLLETIEFLKVVREGRFIRTVVPVVPFFDEMYKGIGEYFETQAKLDEFERLTLDIVDRLAAAPHNTDALADKVGAVGADRKTFDASIELGQKGSFLISHRSRSRSILLNPTYFSENAEIFADHVAKSGATSVKRLLDLVKRAQGWPLSLIEKTGEICGSKVSGEELQLLKRLAQDGSVKPPMISTSYAGNTSFMFTPTPGYVNITPLKREQHERALAIVSSVRQGQLLPNKFRIRSPGAVLYKLKTDLQLSPTTDYGQQYRNLVMMRVARLVPLQDGYQQLQIIDTPENRESLNIAYRLVQGDAAPDMSIDKEAVEALTGTQEYTESLVSSRILREREKVVLSGEASHELQQLLLEGF
jgi:hypothetical protein